MCGLAGILSLGAAPLPAVAELAAMIAAIGHRGPDDTQVHRAGPVGLAHARLSIIDLPGGRQPVHNEDESIWAVFNGEIFNFIELRRELEAAGHQFYTRSDTEVIVHAYEDDGLAFVDRFNGQFAIALWDARQRRLVLARDRVGVRPLFYTEASGRLLFASEMKALFALPEVPRRLSLRALAEVFQLWSARAPATAFETIHALPPGHLLVVDGDRRTLHRSWDWSFPTDDVAFDRPIADYAEELRSVLVDAVRIRLRADVPVGAYLSGGLDSSVVSAIIKRYTDRPLRTFSLGFEEGEFDESAHQGAMATHLGTEHTSVVCAKAAIGRAFPRTIWHTEAPIVRTAPAPLLLLSAAVQQHRYKVVLTGEGADEVLGGYDLFKEAQIRRFWARRPESCWRASLLERLYPYLRHSPAGASARAFFGLGLDRAGEPGFGHLPRWSTSRRNWRFFAAEARAALADCDPVAELCASLPPESARWHPFCRDQYIEAHTLLSGYLLSSQGDRVAMANAVEGRFPFLDHRVIALASRLPILCKMMGLKEKHLLKRAMADLLPPSIVRRTKQPYRAPDSASFFHEGQPLGYVAELFAPARIATAGYFDPAAVARLFDKCKSGRAIGFGDNMAFVGILSTMLLDEMYVRRSGVPTVS